jgi:hypothetical protein
MIPDKDAGENPVSNFCWGGFYGKWGSSERLGDILLVASEDQAGTVQGRLVSEDTLTLKSRSVRLQHHTQSSPVTVISDPQGEFEVALPVGEYRRYDEGSFTKIFERKIGHAMRSMAVESASRLWVWHSMGANRHRWQGRR